MTQEKSSDRPTAEEALDHFERLVSSVRGYQRRWRLKEVGVGKLDSFLQDIGSLGREYHYVIKSSLSEPHVLLFPKLGYNASV